MFVSQQINLIKIIKEALIKKISNPIKEIPYQIKSTTPIPTKNITSLIKNINKQIKCIKIQIKRDNFLIKNYFYQILKSIHIHTTKHKMIKMTIVNKKVNT